MQIELDQFHRPATIRLAETAQGKVTKHHDGWSPYELNGGNVAAVGHNDWLILAADTRITRGYSILKRDVTKIHQLTEDTWILSAGMFADYNALWTKLDQEVEKYELKFQARPSSKAVAAMVSRILYQKRFFPYYAFCIVAGFDEGVAKCWGYDAVGSYEASRYAAQGSSNDLLLPLFDNQFVGYNLAKKPAPPTLESALEIVVDSFQSAAERDTTCGDCLEVLVVRAGKVETKRFPLRKD